ncbi:MAG: CBS domain-containing protein [Candidatus Lokiarchaeota archaeon]
MLPDQKIIKELRERLNISQSKLGEELDIVQSTISRIENGSIDPPYSKFKKIFEYLERRQRSRKSSGKINAQDVMTKDIKSIDKNSTIKDAIDVMNEYKISQVPIISENNNLGSITAKKVQSWITSNESVKSMKACDIKELPFPEIDKRWSLKDVSKLLTRYPAVLVKEHNKYIGIISDADLLKNEVRKG